MIIEVFIGNTTAALVAKVSLGALYGCSVPLQAAPPRQGLAVLLHDAYANRLS